MNINININIKSELERLDTLDQEMCFNNIELTPENICAVMINEVVPEKPSDDFYGNPEADYSAAAVALFQKAGIGVNSIREILDMGVYITNAVKMPKADTTIQRCTIEQNLPFLEKELSLFPNLKVIMLMGDVAKKSYNMISKKETGKNIVPAVSTYKLRNTSLYCGGIRILPSYIMTGKNILIEKSKVEMAAEDIKTMWNLISDGNTG